MPLANNLEMISFEIRIEIILDLIDVKFWFIQSSSH